MTTKYKIPDCLNDCLVELLTRMSATNLEQFRQTKENELCKYHRGLGASLRNRWGLWGQKNSLYNWFLKRGIFHPDDMSGIVLQSLWRKLNNKPIRFKEQVKHYKDFWKAEEKKLLTILKKTNKT